MEGDNGILNGFDYEYTPAFAQATRETRRKNRAEGDKRVTNSKKCLHPPFPVEQYFSLLCLFPYLTAKLKQEIGVAEEAYLAGSGTCSNLLLRLLTFMLTE
jgi:hypothetical protein